MAPHGFLAALALLALLCAPAQAQVIAVSSVALTRTLEIQTASSESVMGTLVCDAMLWEVARVGAAASSVPLAGCMVRNAELRADINPGNISASDVQNVLPFNDTLYVKQISGAQLLLALNRTLAGDLLQVRRRPWRL